MTNHGTNCDCLETLDRERKFKRFQEVWDEVRADFHQPDRGSFKCGFSRGWNAAKEEVDAEIERLKCPETNEEWLILAKDHALITARLAQAEERARKYEEALDDIVHCIYGNEATLPWVERKCREALDAAGKEKSNGGA